MAVLQKLKGNKVSYLKRVLLAMGIAGGAAIILLPPPEGLSVEGMNCLGIAILCITLWVLTPIPLAATSLAAIVLLPLFEILDGPKVFSFFGNSAVFFLLGVFILAGTMMHTGLSKRISLIFLRQFDKSPLSTIWGTLFTCSLLSLFMPEHAVAAMMYPVVMEISKSLQLKKGQSSFGTALFLSLAWGSVVGGIGTFLGGARAPLAVEFLKETFNREISFASWAIAAVPIAVALTIIAFLIIIISFRPEIKDMTPAKTILAQEIERIGPISANEIKIGILLIVTILFWIFGGHKIGLAVIALAAAVMVFVLNIAKWLDIVDYVNWGVIIMYGGAIALGKALAETHAINWLAITLVGDAYISAFVLIIILSVLSKVITELISNAAAVVILVPFSFGFVSSVQISPELLVLAITIPAGLAFILPVGTPPNAIAFASGYISIRRIITPALVMSLLSWIIFILFVKFYWPLVL